MARMEFRDYNEVQIADVQRQYDVDVTPENLKNYIHEAYEKTEEEARELVKKHAVLVTDAINQQMSATYVGDVIACIELTERG